MEIATYWDNMYKVKGCIWGSRHTEAAELSAQFLKERQVKNVLEIGCGYGRDLVYLADQGFNCTGLDLSAEAINMAKGELKDEHITLIQGDINHSRLKGKTFDAVYICNLFHLLDQQEREKLITGVRGFLKPGGVLTGMTLSVSDTQDYGKGEPCGAHTFRSKDGRILYFFTQEMVRQMFPGSLFSVIDLCEIPYHEIFQSGEEHNHIMWFIKAVAV